MSRLFDRLIQRATSSPAPPAHTAPDGEQAAFVEVTTTPDATDESLHQAAPPRAEHLSRPEHPVVVSATSDDTPTSDTPEVHLGAIEESAAPRPEPDNGSDNAVEVGVRHTPLIPDRFADIQRQAPEAPAASRAPRHPEPAGTPYAPPRRGTLGTTTVRDEPTAMPAGESPSQASGAPAALEADRVHVQSDNIGETSAAQPLRRRQDGPPLKPRPSRLGQGRHEASSQVGVPSVPELPDITVTIGRIELVAPTPVQQPAVAPAPPPAHLTLADYMTRGRDS